MIDFSSSTPTLTPCTCAPPPPAPTPSFFARCALFVYTPALHVRTHTARGVFSSLPSVIEYSRVHGQDHDLPPASRAACAGGEVSGEFFGMALNTHACISSTPSKRCTTYHMCQIYPSPPPPPNFVLSTLPDASRFLLIPAVLLVHLLRTAITGLARPNRCGPFMYPLPISPTQYRLLC